MTANFEVIVLDIDGAISEQHTLLDTFNPTVIPLQKRHAELRNWCPIPTFKALEGVLTTAFRTNLPKFYLYGSGDFHHFPLLFTQLLECDEPITMIGLDAHSDIWHGVPGYVWSGQWVPRCLELSHIEKVISIGVDKDLREGLIDLPLGSFTHCLNLVKQGKFEMYPHEMSSSRFYAQINAHLDWVKLTPISWLKTQAEWRPIKQWASPTEFAHYLLSRIPTDAIYLTLDKDGLREEDCYSNYYGSGKQGSLSLEELLTILDVLKVHKKIIGIDTCGDFSVPATPASWLKKQWTRFGLNEFPPHLYNVPELKQINERANIQILNAFV
ncbi:MAG: hypothetical protein AAF267_17155 [Deinococcota bacterium]